MATVRVLGTIGTLCLLVTMVVYFFPSTAFAPAPRSASEPATGACAAGCAAPGPGTAAPAGAAGAGGALGLSSTAILGIVAAAVAHGAGAVGASCGGVGGGGGSPSAHPIFILRYTRVFTG